MRASEHPSVKRFARHVNPWLVELLGVLGYGRMFTRAEGAWMHDHEGHPYLDALGGFGTVSVGHHAPRLSARFERALAEEAWGDVEGPVVDELRGRLAGLSGLDGMMLAASGGEAIDGAILLARVATGRERILYAGGAYHGLNLGALSLCGDPRLQRPFEPLLSDCLAVPYGDAGALDRALAGAPAAAVVLEPVQIEGGIREPPAGYLASVREACSRHGALLVFDEIQAGLGRTGAMFAWQRAGVRPDALVLGKALGGSYCALAAVLAPRERIDRAIERSGGLLPLPPPAAVNVACAVAIEHLDMLTPELLRRVASLGERLRRGLAPLRGHPLVRDVRGDGLLVGIELSGQQHALGRLSPRLAQAFSRGVLGHWMSLRLLERGVICQPAGHDPSVLRLEPPLTLSDDELGLLLDRVLAVFDEHRSLTPLMAALTLRLGKQAMRGWSF